MAIGKNYSMVHTAGDVAQYGDAINIWCDAPEEAHKRWVKEQGVCMNQGPQAQFSMMLHSLCKEASALLGEAVPGNTCFLLLQYILHIMHILQNFTYIAYVTG